ITLIVREALARHRAVASAPSAVAEDWRKVDTRKLTLWVLFWAVAVVVVSSSMGVPAGYAVLGVLLAAVFVLVNGISVGISDSNPISSAFVVGVTVMALAGLTDPLVGLIAGSILLISTVVGGDMQQDRSTGWRLGTNRTIQFRYQAVGILMGAILAVGFAKLFMAAYPILLQDQTVMKAGEQPTEWSAAMTYKFVGVLRSLTEDKPYQRTAIWIGVGVGLLIELLRKSIFRRAGYKRFVAGSRAGRATDFVLDAIVI